MKLKATIVEPVKAENNFIIVTFHSDKTKQHFQVFIESHLLRRMKLTDEYLLDVKWRSIVMPDINGNQTYETQLYTDRFPLILTDMMRTKFQ